MNKLLGHFFTITKHRHLVISLCFKCGMYSQGLKHDLSKYSPQEFISSVHYYHGDKSPITYEKQDIGYSNCWLHHKGRNKHHWEYWTDRIGENIVALEMPFNYVLESVLDKIAASKVYTKDAYTTDYPINFFNKSYERKVMHQNTARQIGLLLTYLKDNGEEKTLAYIKTLYHNWKDDHDYKI